MTEKDKHTNEARKYSADEIAEMVKALGLKNDPASTTLAAQTGHGPIGGDSTSQIGVFGAPGVRPDMYSTLAATRSFLASLGAPVASRYTNERMEILTGQTAGGTTNAASFAGDPPEVGDLKVMQHYFTFGSYYVKTKLNAVPLVGQLWDRSEVPRNILNAGPTANPFIPDIMFQLTDTQSQLALELFKIGQDMSRTTEPVAIQGTAGTDNNRTGWFEEFAGLDNLIKTGYTDSVTGLAAPAADSIVESFDANVTGTDANGRTVVEALTDLYYASNDRGMQVGMNDVVCAFVMRKEAFRRVVDQFAYQYANYRVSGAQYEESNVNSFDLQELRLQMMNGRYLLIDGVPVPVVFSDGIPSETLANNTYKSDIYLVPLTWAGRQLTYMQYFPMNNTYAQEWGNFVGADDIRILNNGLFIVGHRNTGLAKEYHFGARLRLILETPFLAGRLDDIQYAYLPQTRDAIPGTSLYANGGTTYRGV